MKRSILDEIPGSESCRRTERRKLSVWLEEWKLYKALAAIPAEVVTSESSKPGSSIPAESDSGERKEAMPLCVGQIRLLRPVRVDLPSLRPVHVLLLSPAGGDSFLVAPFSRFANPALPGEWRTGLRQFPLRVICLWNARSVKIDVLQASWFCRSSPNQTVVRALSVWRQIQEGVPPADERVGRLGPPLEHPLDPRHEYLQEERELLDVHLGVVAAEKTPSSLVYETPQSTVRKAAEGREEYGSGGRKKPL